MNARLVSQLVGLYPQEWRTRYGEEFQSFLETHPSSLRTVLNVIGGAAAGRAALRSIGDAGLDGRSSEAKWRPLGSHALGRHW